MIYATSLLYCMGVFWGDFGRLLQPSIVRKLLCRGKGLPHIFLGLMHTFEIIRLVYEIFRLFHPIHVTELIYNIYKLYVALLSHLNEVYKPPSHWLCSPWLPSSGPIISSLIWPDAEMPRPSLSNALLLVCGLAWAESSSDVQGGIFLGNLGTGFPGNP